MIKVKDLLLSLALVATAAACTTDEPSEATVANTIAFKTFVSPQGRGTAASQDENANLQQDFGVFVYRNADGVANGSTPANTLYNELVNYTPGEGFSYANTIYWPVNDKLGFYAYSPYYAAGASEGITSFVPADNATPGTPGFTFQVGSQVDNQVDLLVAKAEGLNGGVVPLSFTHALSKVEVQAHTSGVNYRVAIIGVSLKGIHSIGAYSFTNAATPWANQRALTDYTAAISTNGNSKPDGSGVPAAIILYNNNSGNYTPVTDPDNALYLLPQLLDANAQLVIDYNIYNAQTGNLITASTSQELVVQISDPAVTLSGLVEWKKSRRVIYRLNFAPRASGPGSEVQFEAVVTEWSIDYGDLIP